MYSYYSGYVGFMLGYVRGFTALVTDSHCQLNLDLKHGNQNNAYHSYFGNIFVTLAE